MHRISVGIGAFVVPLIQPKGNTTVGNTRMSPIVPMVYRLSIHDLRHRFLSSLHSPNISTMSYLHSPRHILCDDC
jgi:hypothetical protein